MTQILKGSQYDTFSAVRTHIMSNGLSIMPTAAPFPADAQVVALHGGMGYDLVACVASRQGEPPVIPSPKTLNRNRVFLKGGRWGQFPIPDMVSVKSYRIGIWFMFGILSPEGLASPFMLGNLPFPGIDQNEQIPSAYFQYALVNQQQTQTLAIVPALPPLLNGIAGNVGS